MTNIAYALLIIGISLVGLGISNILYDNHVVHYISRKIGHSAGGVSFLLCALLFKSGWWAIGIAASFVVLLAAARVFRPQTFRGVGGTGRQNSGAEIWFPLASIPVLYIGWVRMGHPLLAITPILFMAWGDGVTGLVRSQVYNKAVKGAWGSLAMLVTCLIIAWAFVTPLWIGIVGAVVATVVEKICGDVGLVKLADDNWAIPMVAGFVMFILIL